MKQQKSLKRSSLQTTMKDKLLSLGTWLSLQLAFIITILKEKYTCPNKNSIAAKQLHVPRLSYKEFIGGQRPSFKHLVIYNISWILLRATNYTICLCTPEGTFDFNGVDFPTAAHGVSAIPKSEQADILTTQTGSISNSWHDQSQQALCSCSRPTQRYTVVTNTIWSLEANKSSITSIHSFSNSIPFCWEEIQLYCKKLCRVWLGSIILTSISTMTRNASLSPRTRWLEGINWCPWYSSTHHLSNCYLTGVWLCGFQHPWASPSTTPERLKKMEKCEVEHVC